MRKTAEDASPISFSQVFQHVDLWESLRIGGPRARTHVGARSAPLAPSPEGGCEAKGPCF